MTTFLFGGAALFGAFEWIVPLWLIGVGVAIGFGVLLVLYGLLAVLKTRWANEALSIVREGPLLPVTVLAATLSGLAIVTTVLVPYEDLLSSVRRLPVIEDINREVVVEPGAINKAIPLGVRASEMQAFRIESNRDVTIMPNDDEGKPYERFRERKVRARVPVEWREGAIERNNNFATTNPFFGDVDTLYISNLTKNPAKVQLEFENRVEFPEVLVVPQVAAAVLLLYGLYFFGRLAFPKVAAIAVTTTKEGASQPVFYVALALGAFLLVAFIYIPYNTFGEDVKMLKDSGLTLIMVLGILVALWTSSVSVAEEIEGRTALTLLSKPVGRRQFIFGKFLGVIGPVFLLFLFLGVIFLAAVSYKVIYDAREGADFNPTWRDCFLEMSGIVPGMVLSFLETVVLASISVAISTRLPMLANLMICFSIYVLGHLVPQLVISSVGKFPIVAFMGQLLASVLPNLEHFNVQAALTAGAAVPTYYLMWAFIYCGLYSALAMLLALVLFEDRDVA